MLIMFVRLQCDSATRCFRFDSRVLNSHIITLQKYMLHRRFTPILPVFSPWKLWRLANHNRFVERVCKNIYVDTYLLIYIGYISLLYVLF